MQMGDAIENVLQAETVTTAADAGLGHELPETFLGLDSGAWVALAFALFVLLLWRVGAFRIIGTWLDSQAEKVRSDLAEAAALKAEAEALKAKAAADAAEAAETAKAMIEQAGEEANRIIAQATAETEVQIERRRKLMSERISAEVRAAEAELRQRAADLTVKAAEDILRQRAEAGQLGDLTDSAINALGQS